MNRIAATTAFTLILTDALEHASEPKWLGNRSLLAAPYMLGELLPNSRQSNDALGRGFALQNLLKKCLQQLGEKDGKYYQNLLELRYWKGHLSEKQILAELGISRSKYFRDRLTAIQSFEQVLISHLKPSLRPEMPITYGKPIGQERERLIKDCIAQLKSKQTIALTGSGGLGKTFLAGYLFEHFQNSRPVFWYTFRPHLNDHLNSLLFSLGHFLYEHGTQAPWLQMLAELNEDESYISKPETLIATFRHAFGQYHEQLPLLFFDEIDLLTPGDIEEHAKIVAFLESLHGTAAIVLIGQRVRLEADDYIEVPALSLADTVEYLETRQVSLQDTEKLRQLHSHIAGNPRLLEFHITFYATEPQPNWTLENLSEKLSVDVLLRRILQRLDKIEVEFLHELSVFRRPVPLGAWHNNEQVGVLSLLLERRLILQDSFGGILLVPAYRAVLYNLQPTSQRELFHLHAARVRESLGEFTSAAYHLVRSGEPATAITIWRDHRIAEINQGQGHAALEIFRSVSNRHLADREREALALTIGELARLVGDYEQAVTHLHSVERWNDPILQMEADDLEGDIAELRSEFKRAQQAHSRAIEVAEELVISRLAILHKNLGYVFRRDRLLEQAQREADLASFEAENFQGLVNIDKGNFDDAQKSLMRALKLAQKHNHVVGEAKTHVNLAQILTNQGDFSQAITHISRAAECYEQVGKLDAQAGCKANWAVLHNLAEQPDLAIPLAEEALRIFYRLDSSHGRALAFQALAEAFTLQDDLAEAERFAWQAMQEEEIQVLPDGLRVLGEIRMKQRSFEEADRFIQDSIHHAVKNEDPFLEAYGLRARMMLLLHQGKNSEAKTIYERVMTLFDEMDLAHEAEKTTTLLNDLARINLSQ